MKLAAKMAAGVAAAALLAIVADVLMEHQRRNDLMTMDIDQDWRVGRVLQVNVETLMQTRGKAMARELVETTDAAVPARMIRFQTLAQLRPADLRAELPLRRAEDNFAWRAIRDPASGSEMRYMYIPLRSPSGTVRAAIVAGESMLRRERYVRETQLRRAALGFGIVGLSGLVAALLGARLVDRPIGSLREVVRALDAGHAPPPIGHRGNDEIGDFARELHEVGERLATRERLRHADRLRTVGQLASGVAHELGTPLAVIGVRARMIASGEATGDEAVGNGAIIVEQVSRISSIVRQLLDYSRRPAVQASVIDMRHAVGSALGMLEPLAERRSVTIRFEPPPHPVLASADPTQIQQVVTNLVMNGVQAMQEGGTVEVGLACGAVTPPRHLAAPTSQWVSLRVVDQGPGISPEHLPHIFEPFYTTKPVGEGTGLGLAVVQAIVEEQGGWIEVSSEPGRGACFTVHLAAAAAEERLAS